MPESRSLRPARARHSGEVHPQVLRRRLVLSRAWRLAFSGASCGSASLPAANKARSTRDRQTTAFETHNGRSISTAETALNAPKQSSSMTRRMPQLGGLPTFRNQFANRWLAVSRVSRRVQIGFTLSHFRSRASLGQNGQLLNSDLQKFIT